MQNPQKVKLAVETVEQILLGKNASRPVIGLILGSGLSGIGRLLQSTVKIPYSDIPHFPAVSVASHAGCLLAGTMNGVPILAMLGRCHLYEGRTPDEICMGVRLMAGLGIKYLTITNAAGALNPLFTVPSLMCMSDYINHTGHSPLSGENCAEWGDRFPDMSEPFARALQSMAQKCALDLGIPLLRGVYIGVHGPEMETAAETRMYRQWGADAVGMSTVLEVIAARHMGMEVLGISCLTNSNLPDCMQPAPFEQVLAAAAAGGRQLEKLLPEIVAAINGIHPPVPPMI